MHSPSRPVDGFRPRDFLYDRATALSMHRCARCGCDMALLVLSEIDAREYPISALCPACWDAVLGDEA